MTPSDQTEPTIEVVEYPAGARFIGPGDDVVISAAKLKDFIAAAEQRARLDEAMVESLMYSMELDVDESEVMKVRDMRVAELEQSVRKEQE